MEKIMDLVLTQPIVAAANSVEKRQEEKKALSFV
jgi:hypothetical protein